MAAVRGRMRCGRGGDAGQEEDEEVRVEDEEVLSTAEETSQLAKVKIGFLAVNPVTKTGDRVCTPQLVYVVIHGWFDLYR